jgi:prepilin-type N-terminal cleavage/methylation domain-containing protein
MILRNARGFGGSAARAAGFTLIEVLIATVLLAAGLTLAFATIGAATKTTQRGEAMAAHSERIRAVEGFLRRRLEAVRPVPFNFDQSNGTTQRFIGAREVQPRRGEGAIVFFPDGASTGGRVQLSANKAAMNIDVTWLTGEVRLRRGEVTP